MHWNLTLICTFLACALAVGGLGILACELILQRRGQIRGRIQSAFRVSAQRGAAANPLFKNLEKIANPRYDDTLAAGLFAATLEQSGLGWSLRTLGLLSLATASISAGLLWLATADWLWTLCAALAGSGIPWWYVCLKHRHREDALCKQLPDAFGVMSRAIRAGQTLSAAFKTVADEFESPLSEEFSYCSEQQNLGLPTEVALRDLARRCPVMELQMFVVAMLVQRQSGGNPVNLLNNLAQVAQKRLRLQSKVKAVTGEGRMQAVVLTVLPMLMLAAIFFLNRNYAQILLDRPWLMLGTCGSVVYGAIWIRRIMKIDY